MNKHKGAGDETLRTGVYPFHDSGIKYDGEWRGDVGGGFMHGKGSIVLGLGMVYTGVFSKNDLTGVGKMKLPTGELLTGTFEKGVLNGSGSVDFPNGDRFNGNFVNGVRSGPGLFKSSFMTYDGEWKDDNACGK